jgi:hypothetical protein
MYLAAPDPVKEIKDIASRSINSRLSVAPPRKSEGVIYINNFMEEPLSYGECWFVELRAQMFETTIIYLLHALAHHDDYGTEPSDMENFTIYINFFVDCVGNNENASLLYHLAGQLKTVEDLQANKDPHVRNHDATLPEQSYGSGADKSPCARPYMCFRTWLS